MICYPEKQRITTEDNLLYSTTVKVILPLYILLMGGSNTHALCHMHAHSPEPYSVQQDGGAPH